MITEIHLFLSHTQTKQNHAIANKILEWRKRENNNECERQTKRISIVKLNVYQFLSIRIKKCQQKERANLMHTNSMNNTSFFSQNFSARSNNPYIKRTST